MNKEFVTYALALALKELGFDEPCFSIYKTNGELIFTEFYEYNKLQKYSEKSHIGSDWLSLKCYAPLYQQAFRWFRENHNLMFQIYYLHNGNHSVIIHKTTPEYMDIVDQLQLSSGCVDEVVDCYSYEQAELECLKKLIEIVKEKDE